jgi:hypothetical protein
LDIQPTKVLPERTKRSQVGMLFVSGTLDVVIAPASGRYWN